MAQSRTVLLLLSALAMLALADVCTNQCGAAQCCADSSRGAVCYSADNYNCGTDDYNGKTYLCASKTRSCNGVCYDPNSYSCSQGSLVAGAASPSSSPAAKTSSSQSAATASSQCPPSLSQCGDACYQPSQYCCPNGKLVQISQCNAQPTSSAAAPTSSKTPATTATPTSSKAPVTSATPTTSAAAATTSNNVCPPWLSQCGDACYQPSDYCCPNGILVQKSQCGNQATTSAAPTPAPSSTATPTPAPSSTAAPTSSSKAATSSTTKAATSSSTVTPTSSSPVVVNPSPAPTSGASNNATCNGQVYDTNLYGCSTDGKTQSLCPAVRPSSPANFWVQDVTHNGLAAFNENPSAYKVYRNVKDFGAKGDGSTDDTAAINSAITAYGRCGQGCDSSTIRPALVYFPQGTYRVSSPIIQYYMTQLVGDAVNLPTISALPSFAGMAIIDADPYGSGGSNWYTNQNNFYRQIRNFVIDTTATGATQGTTCIHWQVAQATSLTNIVFKMSTASNTNHQGIWMENGSGSFYSDLVFYGGKFGMWVGNQQFTTRNLTFYNPQTAIYMNWNWGWTFKSLYISGATVGFDMSSSGDLGQQVGSVTLVDALFENTPTGIITSTSASSAPKASGTLTLDNVRFTNVPKAIANPSGGVILAGKSGDTLTVASWLQGYLVTAAGSQFVQGYQTAPVKSAALIDQSHTFGYYFEKPRPQYTNYQASDFVNVKTLGAKGDGQTDDTAALANAIAKYAGCKIIFIPSGTYLITSTIFVPIGSRIVGEVWPQLMASGSYFSSSSNPVPMLRVGNAGDAGTVELSDLLFTNNGAVPGAILVEWNVKDPVGQKGAAGMWDCHVRIGGAKGTQQQVAQCPSKAAATPQCQGVFMMIHITPSASAYIENMWAWTADHDLDGNGQVSIFTARGVLIESQAATWLYGTASEHNVMYQYQFNNAKNIVGFYFQTETPYYQGAPQAPAPFTASNSFTDPDFTKCAAGDDGCGMAWGLRVIGSTNNVYVYGAGHYNFFDNYDQTCLQTEDCQNTMTDLSVPSGSKFYLYGLNTKAAVTMVQSFGRNMAASADFRSTFCSTIHYLASV